jgi:large subunit ribosomal protein L6
MSRLGQRPIEIPEKTEVTINDSNVVVKGPLGELSENFNSTDIEIKMEDGKITVTPKKDNVATRSLWGTYASLIRNMISGVNEAYKKELIVEGVGFKASVQGNKVVMSLGFSHPVELEIPEGLTVTEEKNNLTITGIDKQAVGEFAAVIRSKKKPEPYKGKGIRYSDEIIRRKEGKKTV